MASLRKKKKKRTIRESIINNLPSFELLFASQQSLSEFLFIEHDISEHKKEHGNQNKTLCDGLLFCRVRERFLSNVYDVEEIVEVDPVLENATILEVDHIVEAVVGKALEASTPRQGMLCMLLTPI